MILVEKDEAMEILKEIAYSNRKNFKDIDAFFTHSETTGKINEKNAFKLNLYPEYISESHTKGLFHDCGRPGAKDKKAHTFHEIIGARYFEANAVNLGITNSQKQANRIAQSFRSHFLVYEQFNMPRYKKWLPGFRDTDPDLLRPLSIDELSIVYSDLTNAGGKEISFEDRLADIKERDEASNSPRLKVILQAEDRLMGIKQEFESMLEAGKINTENYPLFRNTVM